MTASQLSPAAAQVLDHLRQENTKQHSADELSAVLHIEAGQLQQALAELEAAGLAASQVVSDYGGNTVMWGLATA